MQPDGSAHELDSRSSRRQVCTEQIHVQLIGRFVSILNLYRPNKGEVDQFEKVCPLQSKAESEKSSITESTLLNN